MADDRIFLAPIPLAGLTQAHAEAGAAALVPDWVQVSPPGPRVRGRDGRGYELDAAQALEETRSAGELLLDVDHAAWRPGGSSEAYGWIRELVHVEQEGVDEHRTAPGIWGRVDWTPPGRRAVEERRFRAISPVVRVERVEGRLVAKAFAGAALTNRPNLEMTLLNAEEPGAPPAPERQTMKLEALGRRLGLDGDASPAEVEKAALHYMDASVPQAHFDEERRLRVAAEAELAKHTANAHKAAVDAALEGAVKAGKVPPGVIETYRPLMQTAEGLAHVVAVFDGLPNLVPDDTEGHRREQEAKDGVIRLSEAEKAMAHAAGLSEEEYLATKKEGV